MILFILKLLIIIYLIYMIFKVKSLIQFNPNANIITIELPDKDKIMIDKKGIKANFKIKKTRNKVRW